MPISIDHELEVIDRALHIFSKSSHTTLLYFIYNDRRFNWHANNSLWPSKRSNRSSLVLEWTLLRSTTPIGGDRANMYIGKARFHYLRNIMFYRIYLSYLYPLTITSAPPIGTDQHIGTLSKRLLSMNVSLDFVLCVPQREKSRSCN